MAHIVSLVPDAHLLMESLRSVGYGVEMAIADIIDNSISADAQNVNVIMEWAESTSRIIITDDGKGMKPDDLIAAMKIGSADPATERSARDLGRFGMGLKTAAFSMGKRLTVISKCDGIVANACWDLDYIGTKAGGQWSLLVDENIDSAKEHYLGSLEHGTAVIIDKLDRIASFSDNPEKNKNSFLRTVQIVEKHLSLIFHRYIDEEGLNIYISMQAGQRGERLLAWDPFIQSNRATQELSEETYWENGKSVSVQPFVLPHKTKFASISAYEAACGPLGWQQHQGFYLYRNKRLIVSGTWFRMFRREPAFNLARIRVDIDPSCDFDWKIDIKKTSATPPLYIKEMLEKTAAICTERSAMVYNSRGAYTKSTASQNLDYVWEQRRSKNGKYSFFINKKHPLLRQLKDRLNDAEHSMLESYLSLVENFAPFMQSGVVDQLTDAGQEMDAEDESAETMSLLNDVKEYIGHFKNAGYSDDEIKQTLLSMPNLRLLKHRISEFF